MKKITVVLCTLLLIVIMVQVISCKEGDNKTIKNNTENINPDLFKLDTSKIPADKYGDAVRYGRQLMLQTAYYIGPEGINGKYLGNKMNCTNCHQDAGTKPYSFNLMTTIRNYPQYRAREGKVLSMEERVNNCVMHPHLGRALPLDSKEMIAFVSYFKWINDSSKLGESTPGIKNMQLTFPDSAASSKRGERLYMAHCARCHGTNGEGVMQSDNITYTYPPLWGLKAYQPGSSMHRVIKMAQWLVPNMPHDSARFQKPTLTAKEAFDIAAFVNDDDIHERPRVEEFNYPNIAEKAIDYDRGPFNDPFSETQHKYGPYQPIIDFWKSKGWKPSY